MYFDTKVITVSPMKHEGKRTYKGLPVNAGEFNQLPVNEIIMEGIHKRFDGITNYLSQCFVARFDLHFPVSDSISLDHSKENTILSAFWKKLVSDKFKRGKNKHVHLEYFWVREFNEDKENKNEIKATNGHYHCFIIFDKHKVDSMGSINNCTGLFGMIKHIWHEESDGGNVHIPDQAKDGLLVRQSRPHEKDDVFYALSYLAKTRHKYVHPGVRNYGGSKPKKYPVSLRNSRAA